MSTMTRRLALGLLIAVGGLASAASPAEAARSEVAVSARIRDHTSDKKGSEIIGGVARKQTVEVFCWRDGKVNTPLDGQSSQRWFLIMSFNDVGNPGVIGFVTVVAFRPQPRVPKCIYRKTWPQKWGPPGWEYEVPPQPNVVRSPYPDPTEPGHDDEGPATPAPTTPAPARTWSETTGGVAHTWTNHTNAGGTQGPSIGSNQTVQIACKLQGFRVADGNTWWYRIAQAPWNNQFYVSADAFYNNGATSGSLRGTPFVDPAVGDC
jgi:hypothetical protein